MDRAGGVVNRLTSRGIMRSMGRRKKKHERRRMKTGRQPGRKSVVVWMVAAVIVIAGVAIISSPQWLAGRQDSDPRNVQSAVQPPRRTVTPSTSVAFLPGSDQESWQEMDDPHSDGWDTEAYHAKVKKQLAQLGEMLVQPRSATTESLASLVTPDFSGGPLVPGKLERVFEDGTLLVQRARSGDAPGHEVAGAEGLAEAIRQASKPLLAAEDARFKFKVIRVDLSRQGGQTTDVELPWSTGMAMATWMCGCPIETRLGCA